MDEDGPRGYVDRRSLRNLSERKGEKGEKPAWIEEALEVSLVSQASDYYKSRTEKKN
jgi:hypothetical protein